MGLLAHALLVERRHRRQVGRAGAQAVDEQVQLAGRLVVLDPGRQRKGRG